MFLSFILYLILNASILSANEAKVCNTGTCPEPLQTASQFAASFAEEAEKNFCKSVVGKPVNVLGKTVTGTTRAYRLTKVDEKKYKIELNMTFKNDSDDTVELNKKWKPKVVSCMNMYAPYLAGPQGEILEFQMSNSAPALKVNISPEGSRSNAASYAEDIDCITVVHEVMHVLGLQDEYKEVTQGYVLDPESGTYYFVRQGAEISAYDCRPIGDENTIMKLHKRIEREIIFGKKPTKSYLKPAHFKIITNPYCSKTLNKRYLDCSQYTMKSSLDYENRKCPDLAKDCKAKKDWLD